MKNYTSINNKTNETFTFVASDGNMAKIKVEKKFGDDITIRDEDAGEEFPLVDEWLSDSAYVSRCMVSGKYYLYIRDTWNGKPIFFPAVCVTKEIVPETTDNEYKGDETTHQVGNWYVGFHKGEIADNEFAFKNYCEKYGKITFKAI